MTGRDWAGLLAIAGVVGFLLWLWIWWVNVKYDEDKLRWLRSPEDADQDDLDEVAVEMDQHEEMQRSLRAIKRSEGKRR